MSIKESRNKGLLAFGKFDSKGANGACVKAVEPNDKAAIKNIIDHHSARVKGSPKITSETDERHAFAEVLQTISLVGDGRFSKHFKFNIQYDNFVKWSTCEGKTLSIRVSKNQNIKALEPHRRDCGRGRNNSIHIAHEMGHCFGHLKIDGQRIYDMYFESVPNECWPTRYSSLFYNKTYISASRTDDDTVKRRLCRQKPYNLRNEEFADVLALYLMNPDLLQESKSCKQAISFFQSLMGEPGSPEEISCANRKARLSSIGSFPAKIQKTQLERNKKTKSQTKKNVPQVDWSEKVINTQ